MNHLRLVTEDETAARASAPVVEVYAKTKRHCSVCTNEENPVKILDGAREMTGQRWRFTSAAFGDGLPNPSPCPDHPGRRHHLLRRE